MVEIQSWSLPPTLEHIRENSDEDKGFWESCSFCNSPSAAAAAAPATQQSHDVTSLLSLSEGFWSRVSRDKLLNTKLELLWK